MPVKKKKKLSENCEHANTHVVTRKETYSVNGVDISSDMRCLVCDDCGEEIFDIELDSENMKVIYDKYRELKGLLRTDEIIAIRDSLGISQTTMDHLLQCNEGTTRRYEEGSIQSNIYDTMARLLRNKENIEILVNLPYLKLTSEEKKQILSNIYFAKI